MMAFIRKQWGWILAAIAAIATAVIAGEKRRKAWRIAIEEAAAKQAREVIADQDALAQASVDIDRMFRGKIDQIDRQKDKDIADARDLSADEAIRRLRDGL